MVDDSAVSYAEIGRYTTAGQVHRSAGHPVREHYLSEQLPAVRFDPNGQRSWAFASVDYRIPVHRRHLPVVLVAGGGLDSAVWASTPDGRPGWAHDFAAAGWPVHAVDLPERGHTAWLPGAEPYATEPLLRTFEQAWEQFRIGRLGPIGWEDRTEHPGNQFPVPAFEVAMRYCQPRWTTTTAVQAAALADVIRHVGRCVLVAHSHGGGVATAALSVLADDPADTDLIASVVLIEPHGDTAPVSTAPVLMVQADYLDSDPIWTPMAAVWARHRDEGRTAGRRMDWLDLPAAGYPGCTHMVMWDYPSSGVAAEIMRWAAPLT